MPQNFESSFYIKLFFFFFIRLGIFKNIDIPMISTISHSIFLIRNKYILSREFQSLENRNI